MPRSASVTLNEVAAAAGVSRRVVSAVVNNERHGNVFFSEATRARVLAAVAQVGYRPNRTAVNLLRRRHGSIGLLVDELDRIPAGLFKLLVRRLQACDELLVVEHLPPPGQVPELLRHDCVDALLLFETIEDLAHNPMRLPTTPVVQINTNQRSGPGCLTYDEEAAAELAVQQFVARGRRQAAFVLPDSLFGHYSETVRFTALQDACARQGLPPPLRLLCQDVWSDSCEHTLSFLTEHPEVDCAVVYFELLATPLYEAAARLGRRIGGDLSVIGYNRSHVSRAVLPRLTTLAVDVATLTDHIMTLLAPVPEGATPPSVARVPLNLVSRQSV